MTSSREFHARRAMADLGLSLATKADIVEGHAMARALLGPQVASLATLERVQVRTRCALFSLRDRDGALIGALSVIPLGLGAQLSLAKGRFDGLNPADDMLARPREPAVAFYGWGMAGLTARARATVIAGAVRFQRDVYGHLPFYARAASSEGEHVLQDRMGARPLPGPGGLVFAAPWIADQRRVA